MLISRASFVRVLAVAASLPSMLLASALLLVAVEADAQNVARARLFRGGSNAGPPGGWPPAPTSVDARVWPPGCGVKQADATPGTTCTAPYFGSHPANPLYPFGGTNAGNVTFDGNGWDIQFTATILGNPGFPVLILNNNEDYGVASFGPGMGAGQAGTITFNATGADPQTLGTQAFTFDANGLTTPTGPQPWLFPPNSAATTPRPNANPPNFGGLFRYTTGSQRYGGTLNLTGNNAAFLVLTFNPGVATTGSFPVLQGDGTPIPTQTTMGFTLPGATLINRNKGVEVQRVRTSMGVTPGGFVSLGPTVGSTNTWAIREGGPFTTGMVTVTQMDRPGVFPTTTTRMDTGGINTVAGEGTIQLVKPFIIRSLGPNGNNGRSFSTKVILDVVPEPGAIFMIAAGALGLLGLGLRSRRRA